MIPVSSNIYEVQQTDSLDNTFFLMNVLSNLALSDPNFLNFVSNYFKPLLNTPDKLFIFIWSWVRKNIQYTTDLFDEILINPAKIIYIKKGDCDDFALLVFTILKALNLTSYYLLLGKSPEGFSHIAVWINNIVIDPTNPTFNKIENIYINKKLVNYNG